MTKEKGFCMQVMTNWKNFTDEELEQIKESLKLETEKRKAKAMAVETSINNFLNAFRELKEKGVVISICEEIEIPLYEDDFYFNY